MKKPIFVRPLSDDERKTLKAGLRSPEAFVLRRCQILLASADGCTAYQIARTFGCHDQTARNVIIKTLSENLFVRLEERRISPRMGLLSVTVLQGDAPYMSKATTTTTKVDYFPLPRPLWRKLNKCLPKKKRKKTRGGGRDRGHPTEPSSTPSAMCFGAAASGRLS